LAASPPRNAPRERPTVYGVFDGVAGDAVIGNGNYDLATETVRSGRITLH
jgi:hypothetical protein